MHTEAAVLTLSQWFSPAYPIGAFAYSHGLEAAIETGDVHDGSSLQAWITDVLELGSGQNDAIFIAAAYQVDDVAELNALCCAFAPSFERLKETKQLGAAFCDVTSAVWNLNLPPLAYPIAIGQAAKLCNLPLGLTLQMYLQSFVSSLVSVGMRLVPLGQQEGHRMIHALTSLCCQIAEKSAHGDLDELSSLTFLPDIASMKHETQYSRVFRT
jgi:urease accessory protein